MLRHHTKQQIVKNANELGIFQLLWLRKHSTTLKLPMCATLYSNKSNNDKYTQLTYRCALVDVTSYCKF